MSGFFNSYNKKYTEYTNLEGLAEQNGLDKVYQVKKLWINYKSDYNPETPVADLGFCKINIPPHQVYQVKEMLEDEEAVKEIDLGHLGFKIETYEKTIKSGKKEVKKTCYKAIWLDVDPDDFPDYSDEDDEEDDE